MAGNAAVREYECRNGTVHCAADAAAGGQHVLRCAGIAQTAGGGRMADRDAAAWNVFPVPLVYECQHDKRYGIQRLFAAAADQSDGSVAGGPQGMASRSPGPAVFYRNSGNDTVSQ